MSRLETVPRGFERWRQTRVEGFRLDRRLDPAAGDDRAVGPLPPGVAELWSLVGGAELFRDRDHGQWGLRLLSPAGNAAGKAQECEWRPERFDARDVVLGEFLATRRARGLVRGRRFPAGVLRGLSGGGGREVLGEPRPPN